MTDAWAIDKYGIAPVIQPSFKLLPGLHVSSTLDKLPNNSLIQRPQGHYMLTPANQKNGIARKLRRFPKTFPILSYECCPNGLPFLFFSAMNILHGSNLQQPVFPNPIKREQIILHLPFTKKGRKLFSFSNFNKENHRPSAPKGKQIPSPF